jgi:hypothetical protein
MGSEKLIHVKLEYDEAVQSKRDILSSEANLLKVLQVIKRYHSLRSEELKIKTKLGSKIREIIKDVRKIETTLPKIKIPQILKEHNPEEAEELEEIESKISKSNAERYDTGLEYQLEDIKSKLRDLAA